MLKTLDKIEKAIYVSLMAILVLVIIISVVELIWMFVESLLAEPVYLLQTHGILSFFEFFLLILIGIELLETIKSYFKDNVIHVEIVVILAIIAIARKVIVIDLTAVSDLELIGIGVVIFALAAGYYLIKKADYLSFKR